MGSFDDSAWDLPLNYFNDDDASPNFSWVHPRLFHFFQLFLLLFLIFHFLECLNVSIFPISYFACDYFLFIFYLLFFFVKNMFSLHSISS